MFDSRSFEINYFIVHIELENGDVERLTSRDILLTKKNIYY